MAHHAADTCLLSVARVREKIKLEPYPKAALLTPWRSRGQSINADGPSGTFLSSFRGSFGRYQLADLVCPVADDLSAAS
jgi:hypothetical protein